jgi:carbon monoxide dehydrogenase subunit G
MEMTGERRLPAPRAAVWQKLNDPETLRVSIPGCRTLEPRDDNGFRATAAVKVGPISTLFTGDVYLRDVVPPESYRIEGSGNGGPAGVAKGSAAVNLADDGAGTLLSYSVKAEVGGKLAQLGARLIDATATQMADQFFDNFARAVQAPAAAAAEPGSMSEGPATAETTAPAAARISLLAALPHEIWGYPLIAWAAAAVFLLIVFNLIAPYLIK